MKLLIGGCRGTHSVAQRTFLGYGGETTSFLFESSDGDRLIVDAGTGIRALGAHLAWHREGGSALILMSHYHLDHTMGLPSFSLVHNEHWLLEFAAPELDGRTIDDVLPRLLDRPWWPLQVEDLAAHVRFKTLAGRGTEARAHGGFAFRWCAVPHPGGATAYRIDETATGRSAVVATDCEWPAATGEERDALLRLCREPSPASLLIMDGQYDRATYPAHRGWGHSAWEDCVDVATLCRVGRLLVTHHDPSLDDEALDQRASALRAALPCADLARDGTAITF
jgi:phosphoribosyl 1,2-cyclic phosphodiesterase